MEVHFNSLYHPLNNNGTRTLLVMRLMHNIENSFVFSLEDNSEIEITVIELEGGSARMITSADEAADAVKEYLINQC